MVATKVFECVVPEFSDADYDNPVRIVNKFYKFLDAHSELKKIDYIVLQTYYTGRLIEFFHEYNTKFPQDIRLIQDYDYSSEKKQSGITREKDLHRVVEQISRDGSVVFRSKLSSDLYKCVDILGSLSYCACCCETSVYSIQWFDIDGKRVLSAKVDCESG